MFKTRRSTVGMFQGLSPLALFLGRCFLLSAHQLCPQTQRLMLLRHGWEWTRSMTGTDSLLTPLSCSRLACFVAACTNAVAVAFFCLWRLFLDCYDNSIVLWFGSTGHVKKHICMHTNLLLSEGKVIVIAIRTTSTGKKGEDYILSLFPHTAVCQQTDLDSASSWCMSIA